MNIGEVNYGFELLSVIPVKDQSANLHLFRHIKTGAQLLYTGREDENKTFCIGFQTLPEDNTGVFHILEHSVLCGSKRYPVKEPFVELMKGSLNTFLNAMTFPDKTLYPISSRNDADFQNLMHVYLDAVFNPFIYSNENIFLQEGWHYEFNDKEDPSFTGVVLGEMKGAFSDLDTNIEASLREMLFPDTCYQYDSGGVPAHIPSLSFDQFKETHRRFYHPSNARIILDGSVNIEEILNDISNHFLNDYSEEKPDFALLHQSPISHAARTIHYEATPEELQENRAHYVLGKLIGSISDVEKNIAFEILSDYLTSTNSSPLTNAVLKQGLGQDVKLYLNTDVVQPFFTLHIQNTTAEQTNTLYDSLTSILSEIHKKGLDHEELEACMNQIEFSTRERQEPYGIQLTMQVAKTWVYGEDPSLYLNLECIFDSLRFQLNDSYFEDLLEELFLDPTGFAKLTVLPSSTLGQELIEKEQLQLSSITKTWTSSDLMHNRKKSDDLEKWQQTPDTTESLSTIPHLNKQDLPLNAPVIPHQITYLNGVNVIRTQVETSGITYLDFYFALPQACAASLPELTMLTQLLSVLPTKSHSSSLLQREIKAHLGSLRYSVESFSQLGNYKEATVYFHISCSVLEKNIPQAISIIREIMFETLLDQPESIQEILQQLLANVQQSFINAGHNYAMRLALSGVSAEGCANEQISGYEFYRKLQNTLKNYQDNYAQLLNVFTTFMDVIPFGKLTLSITGDMDDKQLQTLCRGLSNTQSNSPTLINFNHQLRESSICIPGSVAYAVKADNFYTYDYSYHGSFPLASKIISLEYLWNEIRVQGGAYGAGMFSTSTGNLALYSYRDPKPARSLEIYSKVSDFLKDFCEQQNSFEQILIGTVSDSNPLLSPNSKGVRVAEYFLRGITQEQKNKEYQELINCSYDDLLKIVEIFHHIICNHNSCIVGSESQLLECDVPLKNQYTI